jgi:hypothetical protein
MPAVRPLMLRAVVSERVAVAEELPGVAGCVRGGVEPALAQAAVKVIVNATREGWRMS